MKKTEQINNAIELGRTAMKEGKKRVTWQDNHLIDMLKTHQESVPGNATFSEMFEAWLTGWDSENLKYPV